MSNTSIHDLEIELPAHYQLLSTDEVNQFKNYFGLENEEPLTAEECRKMLDAKLGGESLSGKID